MKTIKLASSDLNVSHICLGTMTYGQQNTEAEAHAQLDYAISQGINFIDAAEMYPVPSRAETTGLTECYVGTWLKKQRRDKIILATKATGTGRTLTWIREGQLHFTHDNLQKALDGSLQRLQTDYVDLYQLHWPDRNVPMFGQYHFNPVNEHDTVPLLETMQALTKFIQAGKIRHWGLSNETPWGLMTVVKLAEQHGLPRPVSVQNAYNLINRTWESGLSEIGYRENIPLLAYSPLGFGVLSGKYLRNPETSGRINLFSGFAQRYNKINVNEAVAAYAKLATQHGLTPTALALAFCYQRWCVGSTIIGATNMEQLKENIAAKEVKMSADVLDEIEKIHLRFTNPAP